MTLDETLKALDAVVQAVSRAVQTDDALALEQSSQHLRDAMLAFAGLAERFAPGDWNAPARAHAGELGRQMAVLREQVARLSALAQRKAAVLIPAPAPDATYERGLNPAGKGQRPTSARIYHAAG